MQSRQNASRLRAWDRNTKPGT